MMAFLKKKTTMNKKKCYNTFQIQLWNTKVYGTGKSFYIFHIKTLFKQNSAKTINKTKLNMYNLRFQNIN